MPVLRRRGLSVIAAVQMMFTAISTSIQMLRGSEEPAGLSKRRWV
jgi:hypothetical protein